MKKIEFTQEEIENIHRLLSVKVLLEPLTWMSHVLKKLEISKIAPDETTISSQDLEFVVTPAKAFENVYTRKKAARIEEIERLNKVLKNEKEAANTMIKEMVEVWESDHSTYDDIVKIHEKARLLINLK